MIIELHYNQLYEFKVYSIIIVVQLLVHMCPCSMQNGARYCTEGQGTVACYLPAVGVSSMGHWNETFSPSPSSPHANSLLAVGTKVGVLLWNVDPAQSSCR